MKKLTNKKGFTLIEMLVVIAIIAVLVAIIIPVVTNSTVKAAAAANAANMRSFKSEITTLFLQEQGVSTKNIEVDSSTNAVSFPTNTTVKYPAMKAISGFNEVQDTDAATATTPTANSNWGITYANNQFTVTYCGHNIDWYATVAETGAAPAAGGGNGGGNG